MLLVQRLSLSLISFVCFFVGGVIVTHQLNEEAHEQTKGEIDHIIYHLLPMTEGTPYPVLLRLLMGYTEIIMGCVLIWFEDRRQSSLLVLLALMLGTSALNGFFGFVYEVPLASSGLIVFSLIVDYLERSTIMMKAEKKMKAI